MTPQFLEPWMVHAAMGLAVFCLGLTLVIAGLALRRRRKRAPRGPRAPS